jgi:hypothetical protein
LSGFTLHQPNVTNATTIENTQTISGLVITPNPADVGSVTNFQITNLTGRTLYQNDGLTSITNGQFITLAQGAAGLKFTPATNSLASGSFTVQESTSASLAGLSGPTATATINVYATAGPAAQLAFVSVPSTATAGVAYAPVVTVAVEDQYGNLVSTDTSAVTLTIASGPGGFAVGSSTTASAVNGEATFSQLLFDAPGTYTLTATDGSLSSATSAPIAITVNQFVQEAELNASDGAADSAFGSSVAISGNTMVICADTTATSAAPVAYVYSDSGSNWILNTPLTVPSTTSNDFPLSAAIDGDTIVIGAPGANNNQGAAYVFIESGSVWPQTPSATLTESNPAAGDHFGDSVSISGNTIVVGAENAPSTGALGAPGPGAAYVFTQSGSVWSQTPSATLIESNGAAEDGFGDTVAISGNTLVVGASGVNGGEGAAYVFAESGGAWNADPNAELTPSDPVSLGGFGSSVAIDNNAVVVGAGGVALQNGWGVGYVFTQSGSSWTQAAKLTPPFEVPPPAGVLPAYVAGPAVAIDNDTIVFGVPNTVVGANTAQGAVNVFGTPISVTGIQPSMGSALGGATVAITGKGFIGTSQVEFGSTPATSFHIVSDTNGT